MNYYTDNLRSIGNTPLVKLSKVVASGPLVLGKIEGRNPS